MVSMIDRRVARSEWNDVFLCVLSADHFATVEVLLKNGVDASIGNSIGVTPLHEAAEKGFVFVFECSNLECNAALVGSCK
jgi:ankyrin repeat protein